MLWFRGGASLFTLPDREVQHGTSKETVAGDVLGKWINCKHLLVAAVYETFNLHLLNAER